MSNFTSRRVWKYLLILSPEEKTRFSGWLKLELQDRQVTVQRLWQNLKCLREAEISRLSETQFGVETMLWSKIFPKLSYDDGKFRRLSEQLIRHIEEFVAIEGFRKDPSTKDLYLLRELGRRNFFQLFQTIYRKVKSRLNRKSIRDEQFFMQHTLLDREFQKIQVKIGPQNMFSLSDYYRSYDKWRLLEYANFVISQRFYPTKPPTPVVPTIYFFECLKNHEDYSKEPLLHLYTLLFELLTDKSDHFHTYFNFLQSYEKQINIDTLRFLYTCAANHISFKANQTRDKSYYEQLIHLYQWGFNNGVLFLDKVLPTSIYKNMILVNLILAKMVQEPDKTKYIRLARHFLEELKQYLPIKDREDAYRFNKANYYFTIGEFEKVEASLAGRTYSNSNFAIEGRLCGLMARYELKDYTHLITAIRSLKSYMQTHMKKDPKHKGWVFYQNHLRFFRRLVQAYTIEDFIKLRKALEKTAKVHKKKWLLEKIEEQMPSSKLLSA